MSQEDMENMGVLLPREQWGKIDLHTTVNKPLLVAIGVITVISAILMYLGNGSFYTWIGVLVFFIMLCGFTLLSVRAVDKRHEKSERIKRKIASDDYEH